jgi:hypothetical protein
MLKGLKSGVLVSFKTYTYDLLFNSIYPNIFFNPRAAKSFFRFVDSRVSLVKLFLLIVIILNKKE